MLVRHQAARQFPVVFPALRGALSAVAAKLRARLATRRPKTAEQPAAPSHPIEDTPSEIIDVVTMVQMLDLTLELAQRAPLTQPREPIDLREVLLTRVVRRDPLRCTMPIAEKPLPVLANPAALERLFDVLLDNALASGTRAVVRPDSGATALVVHVDDNGPGVARAARAHLFDPFIAADTRGSIHVDDSVTLSLAIARQIARAHDGDITVSSSPEGGARFTVRLPLLLAREGTTLAAAS